MADVRASLASCHFRRSRAHTALATHHPLGRPQPWSPEGVGREKGCAGIRGKEDWRAGLLRMSPESYCWGLGSSCGQGRE